MKAGLIQMRSGGEPEANIAAAESLIREAAREGAQLIATPETTNIVQRDRDKLFQHIRTQDDDPGVAHFAALAKELGVWLLAGSFALKIGEGRAVNRSLLFSPEGELEASYDKIHMFDVTLGSGDNWRESATYRPGQQAVMADTGAAKLGLTICYDLRFPALYRALGQAGAEIITAPAAFTVPTGKAHWETLIRARAIENGAYILAPAQGGGHEDGRATWGRSTIAGPWGEVTAKLDHDEPGVLLADLDLDAVQTVRSKIPSLQHDREFSTP